MRLGILASLTFLFAIAPPALAQPSDAETVHLSSYEVDMRPREREIMRNGRLRYLGGIVLRGDHRDFSGLSGLRFVESDTRFLAVNDRGNWVSFTPRFSGTRLVGVENEAQVWSILDANGAALVDPAHDSESLAIVGDTAFVGFERHHRIEAFVHPLGETNPRATDFRGASSFGEREFNGSLEGLTQLDDQRLLAITEAAEADGRMAGWILDRQSGTSEALWLQGVEPYALTDLVTLANGDVVTLERRFSPASGAGARLRLIAAQSIVPGATLDGPELARFGAGFSIDNMEGLAVREIDGRTELYLISDNNQNAFQRNLLLAFELMDE